jgi:hypothetical protein
MSSNCSSHSMSSRSTGRPRLTAPTPHSQDFSVGLDVRFSRHVSWPPADFGTSWTRDTSKRGEDQVNW